jgi:hypothetical protein
VRLRKRSGSWYARFRDGQDRVEVNLRVTNKVLAERRAGQISHQTSGKAGGLICEPLKAVCGN